MEVKLTAEEGNILLEILEERDQDLQKKISHAKQQGPREELKETETVVENIIEKIVVAEEREFSDLWW